MQGSEQKERFSFGSKALNAERCKVVRFKGTESLSALYSFEILIASQDVIDIDAFIETSCTLSIARKDADTVHFHGYPASCMQGSHSHGWTFYTVHMMPQFSKLRGIVHNAIYLDMNVQGIVQESLGHCGVLAPQHEFQLQQTYAQQEFSMQYNEDVYAYICYFLEREGIYYYFDQQSSEEKVIFTDQGLQHLPIAGGHSLTYSPTSGLEGVHVDEVIISFNKKHIPLPKYVHMRDYDWKKPNTPVEATALVSEKGRGELFFYGEGFTTAKEAKRLATIRAEALRCQGVTFQGQSSVPRLSPGYIFTLREHFDDSCNADYLITEVCHEGSQEAYLSMVLGVPLTNPSQTVYYRNSFTCIQKDVPFRAAHQTERKKISGMIHAFIDASTPSGAPEIDSFGRYKVIFPQDISGRGAGKASCWLRRAQTSVGMGYGASFPLDAGVEVLVSFTDGNPHKPFIAAALANAETGSTDSASSGGFSGLGTAGGGGLLFNDQGEKQGVNLTTGSMRSGLFMTSGSLDSTILQSDSLNVITPLTTASASSLNNNLTSRLKSIVSVNGKADKAAWFRLAALDGVSFAQASATLNTLMTEPNENPYDVTTVSKENTTKQNMTALGMDGVEVATAISALDITTLVELISDVPKSPYVSQLHTQNDTGELCIQTALSGRKRQFLMAEHSAHMLTKKVLLAAGAKTQADEVLEDLEGGASEKAREKIKEEVAAYYKAKDPEISDEAILAHQTRYCNYLKEKKITTQVRNWTTQLASLVSEFATLMLLKGALDDEKLFGGIKIQASHKDAKSIWLPGTEPSLNLTVASAQGTRISSESFVSFVADTEQTQLVHETPAKGLLTADKDIAAAMGLKANKPFILGKADGVGFSAKKAVLAKAKNITLAAGESVWDKDGAAAENSIDMHAAKDVQFKSKEILRQKVGENFEMDAQEDVELKAETMRLETQGGMLMGSGGAHFTAQAGKKLSVVGGAELLLHSTKKFVLKCPMGKFSCADDGVNIESKSSLLQLTSDTTMDFG